MEIRKAKYNHRGTIDCEINHPQFGWIPTTLSPDDCEEDRVKLYDQAKVGDVEPYIEPIKSSEELLSEFENQAKAIIVERLEAKARERGYDSIVSAVSYSNSPVFGAESHAFATWRDFVWMWAFELKSSLDVKNLGDIETLLSGMPQLEDFESK